MAACHSGSQALGPDLAGVAGRFSRADLFTAMVQPSKDVPARYRTTLVVTREDKLYQGLIVYEAVDSVLLQTGPATTVRIADTQVSEKRVSPRGDFLAWAADQAGARGPADAEAELPAREVWTMSLDGSDRRPLTRFNGEGPEGLGRAWVGDLAFAPRGDRLAVQVVHGVAEPLWHGQAPRCDSQRRRGEPHMFEMFDSALTSHVEGLSVDVRALTALERAQRGLHYVVDVRRVYDNLTRTVQPHAPALHFAKEIQAARSIDAVRPQHAEGERGRPGWADAAGALGVASPGCQGRTAYGQEKLHPDLDDGRAEPHRHARSQARNAAGNSRAV